MLVKHRRILQGVGALVVLAGVVIALPVGAAPGNPGSGDELTDLLASGPALDGRGNNTQHPMWGAAGTPYLRVAKADYSDGKGSMPTTPSPRYISNRVFNDVGQNLFSENDASQWVWIWGQFIDHDIGLEDFTDGEDAPIKWDPSDPLERFKNTYGKIRFTRTPAAPGTGTSKANPRQQLNQITSFIDASQIYGSSPLRLDWMREGPVDGDPTNNSAKLLLPNGFLPRAGDRDAQTAAPVMEPDGPLQGQPDKIRIAGDFRANENTPLTLLQTLFAREHNRIVDSLASSGLSEQEKFEAARRLVAAEIQFITYNEFLPSVGIQMPQYTGYKPSVNPSISNEFATVGYRAHSMVHGEFDPPFVEGDYTQTMIDTFRQEGIGIAAGTNGTSTLEIPLSAMEGNPDLLGQVGIGRLAKEFADGHQYRNDELIDDSMRSVLFQTPKPGSRDPKVCGKPVVRTDCFSEVMDLGAIDVQRGRDHGMPTYNEMRKAYGLPPVTSFADITGENTDEFPSDAQGNATGKPINDPQILDFTELQDIKGNAVQGGADSDTAQETAVAGQRKTTTAARLKAIYGNVNKVDAFVGMMCEAHPVGQELGALQKAMWTKQFRDLRDGDRFFFANDPALSLLQQRFGLTYRVSLAQIISMDADTQTTQADVFRIPAAQ